MEVSFGTAFLAIFFFNMAVHTVLWLSLKPLVVGVVFHDIVEFILVSTLDNNGPGSNGIDSLNPHTQKLMNWMQV